jgi:diguanylate cyclase (GGDEF)-like protein/PAS domain S-box-containing protein
MSTVDTIVRPAASTAPRPASSFDLGAAALIGLVSFAAAVLSIHLSRLGVGTSGLWLGNALALGILLRRPTQPGPAILLAVIPAGFAAHLVMDAPLAMAAVMAPGSMLQILLSLKAARRIIGAVPLATQPRMDLIRVQAVAGLLAPLAVGFVTFAAMMALTGTASLPVLWTRVAGEAIGAALMLPVMLLAPQADKGFAWSRADVGLLAKTAAVTLLAGAALHLLPHPFIVIAVPLVLIALRETPFRTALCCSAVGFLALGMALAGLIPSGGPAVMRDVQFSIALTVLIPLTATLLMDEVRRDRRRIAASEEQFRAAVDNAPVGMAIVDRQGTIQRANRALADMVGRAELVGMPLTLLLDDENDDASVLLAIATSAPSGLHRLETRLGRADGSWIWTLVAISVLRDAEGGAGGFIVQIDDIDARKAVERVRADLESRWSFALESANQGVWDNDLLRRRSYYSPVFTAMLGYEHDEIDWQLGAWLELVHPEDVHKIAEADRYHAENRTPYSEVVVRMRHKDGRYLWILDRGKVVERDADGRPVRMLGTHTDITAQKEFEAAVRASEERFRSIFALSPVGLGVIDAESERFLMQSKSLCELVGIPAEAFSGLRFSDLTASVKEQRLGSLVNGEWEIGPIEIELSRADGGTVPVILTGTMVVEADGRASVLLVFQDIATRRRYEDRLWALANLDSLTGLSNRMQFNARLGEAIERSKRSGGVVAVAVLDLDNFKDVNDSFGHDAGDEVLRSVARRVQPLIRATDTLARLGGDEFALIMADLPSALDARRPLDALLAAMRQPVEIGGELRRYTSSIGVALYPGDAGNIAELMKNADIALYRAKAEGRDRYEFFEPSMRDELERRNRLRIDVEAGIRRRQFHLVYQPVVDCRDGECVGFEALLRWNHPELGLITPTAFKEAFDDPVLSSRIGQAVIDMATAQARSWRQKGIRYGQIALNMTAADFRTEAFVDEFLARLGERGLPPGDFCVEIKEQVLLGRSVDRIDSALRRLRGLGVEIAFDSFGTGYASLNHLKRFPIDRIKIDGAFIAGLESEAEDQAIVLGLIDLVHRLGITTTAENVTTRGQYEFLRGVGCDQVQGYHVARPMAADDVPGYLSLARGVGFADDEGFELAG